MLIIFLNNEPNISCPVADEYRPINTTRVVTTRPTKLKITVVITIFFFDGLRPLIPKINPIMVTGNPIIGIIQVIRPTIPNTRPVVALLFLVKSPSSKLLGSFCDALSCIESIFSIINHLNLQLILPFSMSNSKKDVDI